MPQPDVTDWSGSAALLGAFGSAAIQRRYKVWRDAVDALDTEHEVLEWNWYEEGGDPSRPVDSKTLVALLTELLPAESAARIALAEAVAHELGHR